MAHVAAGNIDSQQTTTSNRKGIRLGWRELESVPIGTVKLNDAPNKIIVQKIGNLNLVQRLHLRNGTAGIYLEASAFDHASIHQAFRPVLNLTVNDAIWFANDVIFVIGYGGFIFCTGNGGRSPILWLEAAVGHGVGHVDAVGNFLAFVGRRGGGQGLFQNERG